MGTRVERADRANMETGGTKGQRAEGANGQTYSLCRVKVSRQAIACGVRHWATGVAATAETAGGGVAGTPGRPGGPAAPDEMAAIATTKEVRGARGQSTAEPRICDCVLGARDALRGTSGGGEGVGSGSRRMRANDGVTSSCGNNESPWYSATVRTPALFSSACRIPRAPFQRLPYCAWPVPALVHGARP